MQRFYKLFMVVTTVIVLIFMLLGCDYKPKSNDIETDNVVLNNQESFSVEIEEGVTNTTLDTSVRLSAELSTNSNGVLVLDMEAEVYPERLSDSQLYWYITEGSDAFDPITFVPTLSVYRTNHFTFFTNLDKAESHVAKVQFGSCFTETYTIWCISADNPSVYDTLILRCEGAPKYICIDGVRIENSVEERTIQDGSSITYNFSYDSLIGPLGTNYINAVPQITLSSVYSDYCLKYQYMYYVDEYSSTPSVAYIYIPYVDLLDTFISCSLSSTDSLVPVKNYVIFNVLECPENLVGTSYLSDRYYNGKLTSFMGYTKSSKVGTNVNVPNISNYSASDTGYISFTFEDSPLYGLNPFIINISIVEALNVSA